MGALHVVVRGGAPVPLALPCDATFLGTNRSRRLDGLGRRLFDFSLISPSEVSAGENVTAASFAVSGTAAFYLPRSFCPLA